MPHKNIVNETNEDLNISLFGRTGENPASPGDPVSQVIPAGATIRVDYGDEENPYLNGIAINGKGHRTERIVLTRGSLIDDLLNTNNTLIVGDFSGDFMLDAENQDD